MCDIVEEYAKEYAEEYAKKQSKLVIRETEEKMARKLLKEEMSIEKIASMLEVLTAEEVKELKNVL